MAATGFPGRPNTGVPAHRPSARGRPGFRRDAPFLHRPGLPQQGRDMVLIPRRRAAAGQDHIRLLRRCIKPAPARWSRSSAIRPISTGTNPIRDQSGTTTWGGWRRKSAPARRCLRVRPVRRRWTEPQRADGLRTETSATPMADSSARSAGVKPAPRGQRQMSPSATSSPARRVFAPCFMGREKRYARPRRSHPLPE